MEYFIAIVILQYQFEVISNWSFPFLEIRDGFGPGPAQPKSARANIPTWPKVGPGPKVAQRTLAQIGLGPNIFGPGPAQEIVGPDKWS